MTVSRLLVPWQAVRAGLLETIDMFHDDELFFKPREVSHTRILQVEILWPRRKQ